MDAGCAPSRSLPSCESARALDQNGQEDDVGEPYDVFCIEPNDPTITEQEAEYFKETFSLLDECEVGAVWLSEEDAMKVSSKSKAFYFVAVFRGRVFDHLRKLGVNLYGAHVVRQTLAINGSLPPWNFPVYSLNMTGANICFTGMPLDRREELKVKLNYMNGIVSPCLTEKVTHLVTEYCDTTSKKYTEARRMSLPIVLPTWIEKAWEAAQAFRDDLYASKEFTQRYRTPIFNQMVITATGIGGSDRMDMARLIVLNGGRFSGDMKRNECTHLIADQTKGLKYKKAREWKSVKIVRSTWLRKSVMAGYILPERFAFDPEKRNRCSTPVLQSRIVEPEELDCSVIHGNGGRLDNSTFNTQMTKTPTESEHERTPTSLVRSNLRRVSSRHWAAAVVPTTVDPIDELNETFLTDHFDFLEGCRIWVCGAEPSRSDKWKRFLDRSGATRVGVVEAASHVVVVHASASDRIRLIQARARGAHVVRAEWMSACYLAKDQVPYEEFLWDPESTVCQTTSSISAQSLVDAPQRTEEISPRPMESTVTTTTKDFGASDYLNLAPLCNVSDDPDIASMFRALKFRLHGLNADVEAQTIKEIRSAGGTIVPSSDNHTHANYLVCGHNESKDVLPRHCYDETVTTFWVKHCLMDNRLIKPSNHPLFRPLPAVKNSELFSNVVVVISGFHDYERLTLAELVKRFGGEIRERLTRRNRSDQRAVTHVIGGNEGDRVAQARRQKFKVVDPSWLIESIVHEKIMEEELYPFSGEAYASYAGRKDDLWPEAVDPAKDGHPVAAGRANTTPQTSAEDFSDITDVVRTSTPLSSVPSRLRHSKLRDRTLDMNKPYRPKFKGLTRAVENISSSGSTTDTSSESLTTSVIGRILKEGVIKTASVRLVGKDAAADSCTSSAFAGFSCASSERKQQKTSSAMDLEVSNKAESCNEHRRRLNDVLTLRAKMTERLEERNRKIANQFAENPTSFSRGLPSQHAEEVGSMNGRKRFQTCLAVVEPSAKRTSQEHEPLIDWQPAVPSRSSSNSHARLVEPVEATRSTASHFGSQGENEQKDHSVQNSDLQSGPIRHAQSELRKRSESTSDARRNCRRTSSGPATTGGQLIFQPPHPVKAPCRVIKEAVPNVDVVEKNFDQEQMPSISSSEVAVSKLDHVFSTTAASKAPASSHISVKKERESIVLSDTVRHFIFTSILPEERLRLSSIISRLGGVADPGELTDSCTHLICGKLIRGSKIMGCIASGRWVLGVDYIDKSLAAGKWLTESDFEFGRPGQPEIVDLSERERKLAQACRRWRLKLTGNTLSTRIGAFTGWRCVLYCSEEKAAGLTPMLTAGGAEVFVRHNNIGAPRDVRPTHAVVCSSPMWNIEELQALVSVGAKVFHLEYISKFLLDEDVDEVASYHVDYKKFMQSRG